MVEVKPEGDTAEGEKESSPAQKPPLGPQIVTTGSLPALPQAPGPARPQPAGRAAAVPVTTGFAHPRSGQVKAQQQQDAPGGDLRALEEQQASSEEISPGSGGELEPTTSQSVPDNSGSHSRGYSRGQGASGPASGAAASGSTSGVQGAEGSGSRGKKRRPSVPPTEEVVERRKQKRLAKNRVTAAASRERKRNQLASLEQRVQTLEQQNSDLTTELAARNQELGQVRGELASLSRGASGGVRAVRASESAAGAHVAAPASSTHPDLLQSFPGSGQLDGHHFGPATHGVSGDSVGLHLGARSASVPLTSGMHAYHHWPGSNATGPPLGYPHTSQEYSQQFTAPERSNLGSQHLHDDPFWLQGMSELGSQQATPGRQSGPPGIALSQQLSQELPAQLTDPSLDPSPSLLQPATSEELPLTDPALAPPYLGGDQDHHMSEGMDDLFTDWPH